MTSALQRLDRNHRLAWIVLASVAAILAFTFLYPAASYSGAYLGDVLIALEGAYRIAEGQWPSTDFKSPLGFLSYWLPYVGWSLLGQFGGAMEVASVLLALGVTLMAMVMAQARVGAILSALFSLWVFALIVVPMEPGMPGVWSNQSMHYNRWGWPILSTVLLFGIERRDSLRNRWQMAMEIAFVTVLMFVLFWLKVTYFAFGGLFLAVIFLLNPRLRWMAFAAGLSTLAVIGLSGLAEFGLVAYVNDIRDAGAASGVVRGSLLRLLVDNVLELFLVATLAAYLLNVTRPTLYEIAVFLLVPLAGLIILDQNHHPNGPLLLAVLFLYAARMASEQWRQSFPTFLFVLFIVPHAAQMAMSTLTFIRNTDADTVAIGYPGFERFYVGDTRNNALSQMALAETPAEAFVIGRRVRSSRETHVYSQGEMLEMIDRGVTLLKANDLTGLRIFTMDFLNPFPMFVGGPTVRNIHLWIHPGRNVMLDALPSPEVYLADAEVVMVPKLRFLDATDLLWIAYGDYITSQYELIDENELWQVYRLSDRMAGS